MRGSGLFSVFFCGVTWWVGGWFPVTKGRACLLCRPPTPPLVCFLSPIPPTPFPGGEGGDFRLFLCKGLRPLHPRGLNPGGAYSPCQSGAKRGACLFCRLPTLSLAYFPAPIPLTPFPAGRGDYKFILPGAAAPGTPALNRLRHVQLLPNRYPAGGRAPGVAGSAGVGGTLRGLAFFVAHLPRL